MRRRRLLSTVSRGTLKLSVPPRDPGIDQIAQAVRAIATLVTQRNLVGFDFCDLRAALSGGGRAVFCEGQSASPTGRRVRGGRNCACRATCRSVEKPAAWL